MKVKHQKMVIGFKLPNNYDHSNIQYFEIIDDGPRVDEDVRELIVNLGFGHVVVADVIAEYGRDVKLINER